MSFNSIQLSPMYNKKCALVLSGGVVKAGAWHLGVALALSECGFSFANIHNKNTGNKLEISSYVGSSAGSLVNLYFANGYYPKDVINAFLSKDNTHPAPLTYKDMLWLKRPVISKHKAPSTYDPFAEFPMGIRHLIKPIMKIPGIFTTDGLQKYLVDSVISSNDFNDYPDMFVTATQLDHSRKVIFSKYKYPNPRHDNTATYYTGTNVSEAVAASMSVPPFYCPYPIQNSTTGDVDYYIDGEIRETLSTHVAVDNKADFVFSSWTHTPYHYQEEIGSLINYGIPAIAVQSIYLMIQKKIVADRSKRENYRDLLSTVSSYLKDNKFSEIHRKKLLGILETKLNFNPNIKFVDIYPDHEDYKVFFNSSFSLRKENTALMVNRGFKKTMKVLQALEL